MHRKNTDQNNICASIVFKAKTEEEEKLVDPLKSEFMSFETKKKPLKKYFFIFFFCFSFKNNRHTNVVLGNIHMLTWFRIWFRFREDICKCKTLHGVTDTAESDSIKCH